MFIGFVDFITPSHSRGSAVSAGDDASGAFGGDL